MNEEILSRSISNQELWFFPEFLILYHAYKINLWIIPIKLDHKPHTELSNMHAKYY